MGSQLKELRASRFEFSAEMATSWLLQFCPCLEKLETIVSNQKFDEFCNFVAACSSLIDVDLRGSHSEDQLAVLLRVQRLRRFSAVHSSCGKNRQIFASLLELRPDMELLGIGSGRFDRSKSALVFSTRFAELDAVKRICDICHSVDNLQLTGTPPTEEVAAIIKEGSGGCLSSLLIWPNVSRSLEIMLHDCGFRLKHLELHGNVMSDHHLKHVAVTCLHVVTLKVVPHKPLISDEGISAVIEGCAKLLELSVTLRNMKRLDVSRKILQAILDHRRMLKEVVLLRCNVEQADVLWFRQQARALQLIPVPEIIVLDDSSTF